MAKTNVAQEVASVMQKIANVTDDNRGSTIYTEEHKIALEDARNCIEKLLVEYNQVQLDRDVVQQEGFASTEFYEEELRTSKEYILELEMKLEQKEEFITSLQREWQEKYKQQALTLTKEKAEVINQLHAAQDELSSVETFRKYQLEIEGNLEKAKQQLIDQQAKEKQHLVELERKYIEQGNHLKQDYEKSLADIQKQFEKEIEEHVGSKIMHVLQDNERLKEELSMHVDVTDGLQKEKSALQLENAKLSRDLDLLRQAESLHLQRSSSQARCIMENNSKVQKLEKSLGQVIRQYSTERKELEEEHKKQIASLQAEKQTLKRLAQAKISELKKVRQLAQQFLKERGEVESFLIESLHEVGDKIRSSKKNANRPYVVSHRSHTGATQEGSRISLPQIASGHLSSSWPSSSLSLRSRSGSLPVKCPPSATKVAFERHLPILQVLEEVPVKTAPKIDISRLTWEEKEKILRYLFQKIHTAHQIPQQSDAGMMRHAGYELLYGTTNDDIKALS
ncbi:hypothetical protein KP509_29G082900 [Ceratopteris richardii]|uniref:Uncharacterized protein n=1 Tax=Ceratopteris richardii TaxID=49495 RepID=A0A8T2RAN5_CERRI|nr:hypothetical protein KP509_29G082900 [Ceratopteris richardii]